MKRILSLLLMALLIGSIHGQTCSNTPNVNTGNFKAASAAQPDSLAKDPSAASQAVTFNGIQVDNTAKNYNFIQSGNGLVTLNGGQNIYLTGTLQPSDPSKSDGGNYNIRLAFTKADAPSSQNIKLELKNEAYVANGGSIDPSTWSYYSIDPSNSYIVGQNGSSTQGNSFNLLADSSMGTLAQVGTGANGKNGQFGLSAWLELQGSTKNGVSIRTKINRNKDTATTGSVMVGDESSMDVLDINVNLGCEGIDSGFNCETGRYSLSMAIVDPSVTGQAADNDQALWVSNENDAFFGGNKQWVIAPQTQGLLTLDSTNGNANILIRFVPKNAASVSTSNTMDCKFVYSPTIAPSNPKQELSEGQYVAKGGSINPFSWAFFNLISSDSSCTLNGSTLTGLSSADNMPMQLGVGASGKNLNFGLASWIAFGGNGNFFDINLDAVCTNDTSISKLTSSSATTIAMTTWTYYNTITTYSSSLSTTLSTTSSSSLSPSLSSSFLTLYSTNTPIPTSSTTGLPCLFNISKTSPSFSQSPSSFSPSPSLTTNLSFSSSSYISSSSKSRDLPGTGTDVTPTPTSTPVQTCPAGCQPIPAATANPTETPAGNGAGEIEISKLLLAVLSLFVLAFFH